MRTCSLTNNAKVSIATLCTAGLVLVGCGTNEADEQPQPPNAADEAPVAPDDVSPDPDPDAEAPTPEPEEPEEIDQDFDETSLEPVGEFSTELQQSEGWPAFGDTQGIYPVEVRSAVHDDFERIVIEHAGTGIPSHMAQYTYEPVEPGRGHPVETGDEAYLEVIASGTAQLHEFDEDEMIDSGTEITELETEATGTVVSFAPWEATSNYIIGLDDQRPYAVAIFDDPVRVVVDIQLEDQ